MGGSLVLSEGDVIADKYRVERVLGAGGMGVVVAARHLQLDERVAIKLMLPQALGSPEAVARFGREARAAVRIKSEHVARVIDVGTLPDGAPYLVMEFLEGEDLAHRIAQRGALPIQDAVEFVLQACEALAEAHSLGIVHRDLKPANLFCIRRADGRLSVKVLDFGISKMASQSGSSPDFGMTKTSAIMGSPLYMSPEQMQSARTVDARSDIWALGAVLFELLAARPPFMGETFPELVLKVAGSPPESLATFRPDVPTGLASVILRCLEKDRARRYQNVGELAVALCEFGPKRVRASVERVSSIIQAAGLSTSALVLPPSSEEERHVAEGETAPGAAQTLATWGRTRAPEGKGRGRLYAVLGTGIVAMGAGGVGFALRGGGADPSDAATASTAASAPIPGPEAAALPRPTAVGGVPPSLISSSLAPVVAPAPFASAPIASAMPPVSPSRTPRIKPTSVKPSPASAPTGAPVPATTKPATASAPAPPAPAKPAPAMPKKSDFGGRL